AHSYARQIGNGGYTIISGLARGIDKASHEGSLATGTIAVLANGLDHIYPADHEELFNQIAQQGLILSERALGTKPNARLFPARNRLIASLSRAVLIVEAARNSGSMITAREAADRGVDVLAIPGSPLDPRSAGCNQLIKDGAYLVQSVDDIFAHIENQGTLGTTETGDYTPYLEMDTEISSQQIDELKDKLLECLSHDPISVDELARFCHVSAGMINAVILELELSGGIQRHYGNKVSRAIDMPQSID
ncbi:MAG: DNA-processing protein DprA, partial [Candidatus Puniceispirillaceae bacterium]